MNQNIHRKIFLAWLLIFFALIIAGIGGDFFINQVNVGVNRLSIQAVIMSATVLPGIYILRRVFDDRRPKSIGLTHRPVLNIFMGLSLVALPLIFTLIIASLFGWTKISVNLSEADRYLIPFFTVLFFEAIPEELVFRGYIYSNLNTRYSKFKSAIITTIIFVILPPLAFPLLKLMLGEGVHVGGSSSISLGYVLSLLFFGGFVQYLRILTKSIWTGVGFHLVFVLMNKLMGTEDNKLIQFKSVENETHLKLTLISLIIVAFLCVILYPIVHRTRRVR